MGCKASSEFLTCTACRLHRTRTQVVPGHGNLQAEIAFIAEAPGRDEDKHGVPLVGQAGRRFDLHLARVGVKREEIWCDNMVHCRPPGNRIADYPDAVYTCPDLWLWPRLREMMPRVIVAMGLTAAQRWFPGMKAKQLAGLVRSMVEDVGGERWQYEVVGSYHPSAALRKGNWNDIDDSIVYSIGRAVALSLIT